MVDGEFDPFLACPAARRLCPQKRLDLGVLYGEAVEQSESLGRIGDVENAELMELRKVLNGCGSARTACRTEGPARAGEVIAVRLSPMDSRLVSSWRRPGTDDESASASVWEPLSFSGRGVVIAPSVVALMAANTRPCLPWNQA